jgi:hypothetical protein
MRREEGRKMVCFWEGTALVPWSFLSPMERF